jgi:hypothetical protein
LIESAVLARATMKFRDLADLDARSPAFIDLPWSGIGRV